MRVDRRIRRSQVISPFGVGSIFDIGDESLIACDITQWGKDHGEPINLARLQTRLLVRGFKMPPVPSGFWDRYPPKLPFYRFPQWMFCPSCRQMKRWSIALEKDLKEQVPRCTNPSCRGKIPLVPMRFVMACEKGHLSDIPWDRWAHSNKSVAKEGRCEKPILEFKSKRGVGGGLESLVVLCRSCKQARSLNFITNRDSMKTIGVKCPGRQPWQHARAATNCDAFPVVLQRGASNLYYPVVVSALDIPCGSSDLEIRQLDNEIISHGFFKKLKELLENSAGDVENVAIRVFAEVIANDVGCDIDEVLNVAQGNYSSASDLGAVERERELTKEELLAEEWPALVDPPKADLKDRYLASKIDGTEIDPENLLLGVIDQVTLVQRLREVRALRGFHRVTPGDDADMVPVDLGRGYDWLPAVEVFGEGIFIIFSEEAISDWQNKFKSLISKRIRVIEKRIEENPIWFLPQASPRFLMLHTFSHLLMRQLSFECGYLLALLSVKEFIQRKRILIPDQWRVSLYIQLMPTLKVHLEDS